MSTYTEDHLVEQPAIQLMQHELSWEVVLVSRWRSTLQRLNPELPGGPFFSKATNGKGD